MKCQSLLVMLHKHTSVSETLSVPMQKYFI